MTGHRFGEYDLSLTAGDRLRHVQAKTWEVDLMVHEREGKSRSYLGFKNIIIWIENFAAILAGVTMLFAMVLTSLDAILRYSIKSPISFNYFLTENYLMVGMVCLPLAWGFRTGGYIRITFISSALPSAVGNLLLRAGLFASFLLVANLTWLSWKKFLESYQRNEIIIDVLDWQMAWSWVWVPIGLGLLAIRLLMTTFGPSEELDSDMELEEESQ